MKKINYNKSLCLLAALFASLLVACSGDDGTLQDSTVTKGETAAAQLVSADLPGLTAGNFQTSLETALGENALNVQKLTLKGEMNGTDVLLLKKLSQLEEIDMAGVVFVESDIRDADGNWYGTLTPETVPNSMLSELTSLRSVVFPTSVTGIGEYACARNPSLTAVTFPPRLTTIDIGAFEYCSSLESISLPQTLKVLRVHAFYECPIKSMILPEGVERIDSGNFTYATLVSIPSTATNYDANWFGGCAALETVILNLDIEEVPQNMFSNCPNLKNVQLKSGVTSIGEGAFSNCTSLTDFSQFDQITTIGAYAFQNTGFEKVELSANVRTVKRGAFNDSRLRTLTVPATVTTVEGSIMDDCSQLSAVFWDSTADVYDKSNNYGWGNDCYLYLGSKNTSYGPNWKNVIVEGVAENIEFYHVTYADRNNTNYYCPKAFKAKKISYTKQYTQGTGIGTGCGWYTLALPFAPTSITHETKGKIAPFGSSEENAKNFWLRELKADGFTDATVIEANKAYIIAMPNNSQYMEDYRLNGNVTFSAENVVLEATPDVLPASEGPEFKLQPTFQWINSTQVEEGNLYVLNVEFIVGGFENGSVFANWGDVAAFEAYAVPLAPATSRSCFGIDTRSPNTRAAGQKNESGKPMIGDM